MDIVTSPDGHREILTCSPDDSVQQNFIQYLKVRPASEFPQTKAFYLSWEEVIKNFTHMSLCWDTSIYPYKNEGITRSWYHSDQIEPRDNP
jgi:hypothetical protein